MQAVSKLYWPAEMDTVTGDLMNVLTPTPQPNPVMPQSDFPGAAVSEGKTLQTDGRILRVETMRSVDRSVALITGSTDGLIRSQL